MQDNAETSDDIKDRAEFVFRMGDGSRRRFVSEARRVGVSTSAESKMISSVAN